MGIQLPWLGNNDAVQGNIWTSIGVASGKLGGALASLIMMKYFTPPEKIGRFVWVFVLIFVSTLVVLAFPAIIEGNERGVLSENASRALFLAAFFLYFFFSTLPKLGLMCLFQSMVSQIENGPRVFGFVAIIAMTFDAVVVMALSMVFEYMSFKNALWVTAFVYVVHGVLELICGPLLVVMPLEKGGEDNDVNDDGTASMASKKHGDGTEDIPPPGDSIGVSVEPNLAPAYASQRAQLSRLDGGGEGYYTQRSAAVSLPQQSTLDAPVAESAIFGVMSVSKNFAYGSLARRKSRLASTLAREGDVGNGSYSSPPPNSSSPMYGSVQHANSSLVPISNESNLLNVSISGSYVRRGSSLLPPSRKRGSGFQAK